MSCFHSFLVPPQVIVSPESLVASPNSNATFQCNATGIPDPVVTWAKQGVDVPRTHLSVSNVLTLTRIVSSDEGRYICTAANVAGISQKAVTLTVEGLYMSFEFKLSAVKMDLSSIFFLEKKNSN